MAEECMRFNGRQYGPLMKPTSHKRPSVCRGPATASWWQSASHLCAVVSLLWAIGLLCPPVEADEWRGWRGEGCEGQSQSSNGPTHWSRHENILWKTPIPGEGYSSPIVSQDGVYLTTAREIQAHAALGQVSRFALVGGVLLLATLAIHFVVQRCGNLGDNAVRLRSLLGLAGFGVVVAMLSGLVLFGEGVLQFDRAAERGWMGASAVGLMCLVLCALCAPSGSRARLVAGISLLVFAVVVAMSVPDRTHAFEDGPLSAKSGFMYYVRSHRTARPRRHPAARASPVTIETAEEVAGGSRDCAPRCSCGGSAEMDCHRLCRAAGGGTGDQDCA